MTPIAGLLLTTCALLAAPTTEKDASAQAEATLHRVAKLPPEQQQIWLRLLEQRCGWAALLTMKPDEARSERDRVAKILHQKTITWDELVALLRQLDQREKAAVSHMVRVYRNQVYENFGQRDKELIDRQEAWFRIWSAWERAGSPPDQQDRLMDWLADAIKASSKDTLGPLPADPKFGPDVELVSPELVKRMAAAKSDLQANGSDFSNGRNAPHPEIPRGRPLPLHIPDPQWSIGRQELQNDGPIPHRGQVAVPEFDATIVAQPPQLRALTSASTANLLDLRSSSTPRQNGVAVALDYKATNKLESAPTAVVENESRQSKPQTLSGIRPPADLPTQRPIAVSTEPPAADSRPIIVPPATVSFPESANSGLVHASDLSPYRDIVAVLPHPLLPSGTADLESPPRYEVQRSPLLSNPVNTSIKREQNVQVNLEELGTRIEGINLSLRTLEGELNEKHDFTVDQLNALLSRLDILVLRQRDLAMFRDLITPQEQAKVGQVDSSRSAVAALGTHIAELRARIRQNESLSDAEREAALKQLDDLSDRLATLTAGK